jgi:hypothetical protein
MTTPSPICDAACRVAASFGGDSDIADPDELTFAKS